jgi:hypothetical protein
VHISVISFPPLSHTFLVHQILLPCFFSPRKVSYNLIMHKLVVGGEGLLLPNSRLLCWHRVSSRRWPLKYIAPQLQRLTLPPYSTTNLQVSKIQPLFSQMKPLPKMASKTVINSDKGLKSHLCSQAVIHSNIIYVSGNIGADYTTMKLAGEPNDIYAQTVSSRR